MQAPDLESIRPPFDRIGPYVVLRQLPATGALQVYVAREIGPMGFARDVVLKITPRGSVEDERAMRELAREATACARLNHPCIVRTHQFFEHDEWLVLAIEHVDGVSLADLLKTPAARGKRPLDDDAAFHIGISILEALAHAHGALDENGAVVPVVHRAVSPSNVLIGQDGGVKLGGFAFAKSSGSSGSTASGLTWEPGYMAPEQVSDHTLTPKVDVYAAGLILWELLAGRPAKTLPKDPLAIEDILRAVTHQQPESLSTLRRDLPRELAAAIDASLVASAQKRTIRCAEMAAWMRKVVHVGEARKVLGARVRAAVATARASSGPPVASHLPAPPKPSPPAAKGAFGRDRTLIGVAPPAPRAPGRPSPTAAPKAALPPPPVRVRPAIDPLAQTAMAQPMLSSGNEGATPGPMDVRPLPPAAMPVGPQAPPVAPAPQAVVSLVSVTTPIMLDPDTDAVPNRPSLIDRLQAPTRWSRMSWVAAWIALGWFALGLVLASTILRLRAHWHKTETAQATAEVSASVEPPSAPAAIAVPTPTPDPPPEPVAVPTPTPDPPLEPVAEPVGASDPSPPPPGYGYLTVHSFAGYANVYVMFTRYGHVEERLSIPCGKRFVSIGIASQGRHEPIWLAPGRRLTIGCGESQELTLNPRALRQRI